MPIHQMLRMERGALISLEAIEEVEVTIFANEMLAARGQGLRQREPLQNRGLPRRETAARV
jgi:hypothetical protein